MKYLLVVYVSLLTTACFAQQKQYVFLLKNSGERVHTPDSMDYIRVVKGPNADSKLYNVAEYYPSGKPKSVGQSSVIDPILLEGVYTTYWPNGTVKTTADYQHNKIHGDISDFFRNGQLHSVTNYTQPDSTVKDELAKQPAIYFKTCNDSTGKALLVNGNGYYVAYDDSSLTVTEEGNVKEGKRVGEWNGTDVKEKMTYKEIYDTTGTLISGTSTGLDGIHTYKIRYVSAQYKGGAKELSNYEARSIRYPAIAREKNIQGKVIISFIINKSGELEDIKVHQTVSKEIDAECLRVLKASSGWLPAVAYGRKVNQRFFVPIKFRLGPK